MAAIRISLAFRRLPDANLHGFADNVFNRLTGNVSFPTLAAELPALSAAVAAFELAITGATNGSGSQMADKVAKRIALLAILRELALAVQSLAKGDVMVALSSGFELASLNRTPSELAVPLILAVTNVATTQLGLKLTPVKNARVYEIWLRVGAGEWRLAQTFPNTRGVVLTGLTPGTLYEIKVRAVGGSTGYSQFCGATQHMST